MQVLGGILVLALAGQASAADLPVFDQNFGCTTPNKADQYVADFKIDLPSFGGRELCNPAVDTKKLFDDLELVEGGQFTGTQTNPFIRNFVDRDNYYAWMKDETLGMFRGDDDPTATAYNAGGYFTMQNGWAKLSTLGRVGTITHEARHSEGYGHTSCTHGPYAGTGLPGCDESVSEAGAHAIEMEYYARVAVQGANYHPVYKSMARMMLLARANFVFNKNPMSEHDGLLALTNKGLIRVNNKSVGLLTLATGLPKGKILKRTSFGATLLDLPGNAWAIDIGDSKPKSRLEDDYSYFKLLRMTPPPNLKDVEEFDIGNRRYIFAADSTGQVFSYLFGHGAWSKGVQVVGFQEFHTVAPDGREGIFALLDNGTYCNFDTKTLACTGLFQFWLWGVRTIVAFRGEALTLGQDGVVRHSDGTVLKELQGLNVQDLVSVPQYNAFE